MKLFNYDSPFWSFLNKIADLVLLNVLWLVFCIPIITIGASTAAMYRVTLNMHRGEGGGVIRTFWNAFKQNIKPGTLIFLVLLVPLVLVIYEAWLYLSGAISQSLAMGVVFLFPSLLMALVTTYVYPRVAQFDNKLLATLKNACLLAIANLPCSLLMALLNLSAPLLFVFATGFFFRTGIFWLLIGGALVAFLNTFFIRKIFKKTFHLE